MIRPGTQADLPYVAAAFRRMWHDIGIADADIVDDAEARVSDFVAAARDFRSFVAEIDGGPAGVACGQRFAGLYPAIIREHVRDYGYVWGVYVEPHARRRGLGEALTRATVDALRDLGCSDVILHAAPQGRGIYERLGFVPTAEMKLPLR